jgi:hypothetical protein
MKRITLEQTSSVFLQFRVQYGCRVLISKSQFKLEPNCNSVYTVST